MLSFSLRSALSIGGLLSNVLAAPVTHDITPLPGCGEVNVFFTGLPPYHPSVAARGFNSSAIDAALRRDSASILAAGYNLRIVLAGPEQNVDKLYESRLCDREWSAAGIGFGVRSANATNATIFFEDLVQAYRDYAPSARVVFNYSPESSLWALQRTFPLSSNCTDQPGQDLGYEQYCDSCEK